MQKTNQKIPVYVALDYPSFGEAMRFVESVKPADCCLKVGSELFMQGGAPFVRDLVGRGFDVFLDLKFHDIPNTVASAAREAALMGVRMFTIHAAGGAKMISAATNAAHAATKTTGKPAPIVLAVTVLTSISEDELHSVGVNASVPAHVARLAKMAFDSGTDGLVCSPLEAPSLRQQFGSKPFLVTPGIRLAGDDAGDQARVLAPNEAVANGANALVIGRSITRSADPVATLKRVFD